MSDLFVDPWGAGTPVVLVHGSLATGAEEWQAQRPLADEDFRLLVVDRRGYGQSPAADGEDFLRDADDIAQIMGDGAHLVGHSYGGLGVMLAAARRPDATLSLTLLEPPSFTLARHHRDARALVDEVRRLWDQDLPDDEWVVRFLTAVGSNPDALPCPCSAVDDRSGKPSRRSPTSHRQPSRLRARCRPIERRQKSRIPVLF